MIRTLAPALCALSALALGACSQQNADFLPGSPPEPASSAPASAGTPTKPPLPAAAERASSLIGLPVKSRSGQPLGTVQDIVFGTGGKATHLIVTASAAGSGTATLTPVPWAVAIRHLHGGALVFKARRFTGAPGFPADHWPTLGAPEWSSTADAYWSRTAGQPFTPIDPTSRSRVRPTMNL